MSTLTAKEKLVFLRVRLLKEIPFFGSIAMGLPLKEVSELPTTMATDGRFIYFNSKYLDPLKKENVKFDLAHEILHVVLEHMAREKGRNHLTWNVATDNYINLRLVESKIGEFYGSCCENRFKGRSSEAIYEILKSENREQKGLRCHISFDNNGKAQIQLPDGSIIESTEIEPMTAKEAKQVGEKATRMIIQAAKFGSPDKIPSFLRDLIDEYLNPKVDWREIIQNKVSHMFTSDFSFSRPSRKCHSGIILPKLMYGERVNFFAGLDTSGSITNDMIKEFLAEIKGIMSQYQGYTIILFCFDTEIHNVQVFDEYQADMINEYKVMGGGGTEFMAIWNWMEENDHHPDQLIVFTDGYPFGSWGNPDYCDTVFLINSPKIVAPFGLTVEYTR